MKELYPNGLKTCSDCKQVKSVDNFYIRDKVRGYRYSHCKDCKAERHRKSYEGDRAEKMKASNAQRRERVRNFINQHKSKPCMDCGQCYPPYVMDFDHRDPASKSFSIGGFPKHNLEVLAKEIEKCDVVCANCHRIRTFS